jgi:hypothetical protein
MNAPRFSLKRPNSLLANILLFAVLFSISVGIRIDNLASPIGRGHEWVTAHALITISMYEKGGGPSNFHFASVVSYDRPADKYLISQVGFKDKNNFGYYLSYPPGCFLMPYYAFKLVGAKASVAAIRYFGLFIHLICAFLLFLIVMEFYGKKLKHDVFLPAFLAAGVYLFGSGNLWFHSNIYFADTLVPAFTIGVFYLIVRAYKDATKLNSGWFLFLVFLLNFLGAYTEWLQVFFAFAACACAFIAGFKDRRFFRLWGVLVFSTLLSLGVTIWQYSGIAGLKALETQSMEKYAQRSGRDVNPEANTAFMSSESFRVINLHYERQLKFIMSLTYFAVILLAGVFLFKRNKREFLRESRPIWIPMLALLVAILMHLLIFYNFNCVHDFGTLKTSILFTLIIGVAFGAIDKQVKYYSKATRYIAYAMALGLYTYMISLSIDKYYTNNNSNQLSGLHLNVGTMARIYAKPDEMVFAPTITPITTYCAQSIVLNAGSITKAVEELQKMKYPKGIFIDAEDTPEGKIKKVVRITANGDTTVIVRNYVPPRIDM